MIKMVMHDMVKYGTKNYGESKIVERQRNREGERQSLAENEGWRGQ
jgi:hypothetical protein